MGAYVPRPGYDALWEWFGMSYASWLTMPRAFMHEMPDEWQAQMARLCQEWDEHWKWTDDMPSPQVAARKGNRYTRWPDYVLNYRHPDYDVIATFKAKP